MNRFTPGNRLRLLRSGAEYFPALVAAIDSAEAEVYLECYIFAEDAAGHAVAEALKRAAGRGVAVHLLVDGWGAKAFLRDSFVDDLRASGVRFAKYRPEIAPWQFRSRRLRRLHRKLCQVDTRVAFVGGINVIDDHHTPGHIPPRVDFAVQVEGPLVSPVVRTMKQLWALIQLVQLRESADVLFPEAPPRHQAGTQVAKFVLRDNLRHRRDIERAYLAGIRVAREELLIANAYFLPGVRFRRELLRAAARGVRVVLLLQGRVEYALLRYASRALYGQLLAGGIEIHEHHRSFLHAKVAVADRRWATVGSSNIDPFSLLMAREANIFVRDPGFATELREEIVALMARNARRVEPRDWASRPRWYKAFVWSAYGFVRFMIGVLGYGTEGRTRDTRRTRRPG